MGVVWGGVGGWGGGGGVGIFEFRRFAYNVGGDACNHWGYILRVQLTMGFRASGCKRRLFGAFVCSSSSSAMYFRHGGLGAYRFVSVSEVAGILFRRNHRVSKPNPQNPKP